MSRRDGLRHLLNTLPRLAALDGHPVAEVCRELGLSREQLLETIQSASALSWGDFAEGELVDIWVEKGRLCVHTGGLFEQAVRLVPQELLALRLGSAQLLAAGLEGDGSQERLLARIEKGLGGPAPEAGGVQVGAEPDPALDPAALETVLRAHHEHRLLRIWYFSRRSERLKPRLIEAWWPFQEGGVWYLHALDRDLGEERVFRLDRIAELRLLDVCYTPPDEARLAAARKQSWSGTRRAVVLAGGVAARLAREQGWPGQVEESGGRVRLTMPYTEPDVFLRYLLPNANDFEILEPAELKRDWLALLEEMQLRHGGRCVRVSR